MKRTLLMAFCALALFQSARALESVPNEEWQIAEAKTVEGAGVYITLFLKSVDTTTKLTQNSAFIERTGSNGDRFLLAKALITYHTDNGTRQEVRGIVWDVAKGWTNNLSEADYAAFLSTGNRDDLKEPTLHPDPTAAFMHAQGFGSSDSAPINVQIVNIRSSDVVATTDRSSLTSLIQLNGVHNKPAIRQLYIYLEARRQAFTVSPGTVIYVQDTGNDGIDIISIPRRNRWYYISHTDVSEAINLRSFNKN
jgi:hypothetical protein